MPPRLVTVKRGRPWKRRTSRLHHLALRRHLQGFFGPPHARRRPVVAGAVGFARRFQPQERVAQRVARVRRRRRAQRAPVGVAPVALVLLLEAGRRAVAVAARVEDEVLAADAGRESWPYFSDRPSTGSWTRSARTRRPCRYPPPARAAPSRRAGIQARVAGVDVHRRAGQRGQRVDGVADHLDPFLALLRVQAVGHLGQAVRLQHEHRAPRPDAARDAVDPLVVAGDRAAPPRSRGRSRGREGCRGSSPASRRRGCGNRRASRRPPRCSGSSCPSRTRRLARDLVHRGGVGGAGRAPLLGGRSRVRPDARRRSRRRGRVCRPSPAPTSSTCAAARTPDPGIDAGAGGATQPVRRRHGKTKATQSGLLTLRIRARRPFAGTLRNGNRPVIICSDSPVHDSW